MSAFMVSSDLCFKEEIEIQNKNKIIQILAQEFTQDVDFMVSDESFGFSISPRGAKGRKIQDYLLKNARDLIVIY